VINNESNVADPDDVKRRVLAQVTKGLLIGDISQACGLPESQVDRALIGLAREGELSLERITESFDDSERGEIEAEILFAIDAGENSLQSAHARLNKKYPMSLLRMVEAVIKIEVDA